MKLTWFNDRKVKAKIFWENYNNLLAVVPPMHAELLELPVEPGELLVAKTWENGSVMLWKTQD